MSATAIVGANWGDEGKGKTTDYLAAESDIVIRFQGGNNAGHTIINDFGKFALHLLPSGIFYPDVTNILGPGVAVNIPAFLGELESVAERDVPTPDIRISDRAQVVMPYHLLFDQYEEERLKDEKFGSTKSGMAPFYADKYLKLGIQVADLYDRARLQKQIEKSLVAKNNLAEHLYGKSGFSATEMVEQLAGYAEKIKPYVCDTTVLLHDALKQGKRILLEGQLGALRDPDHGVYPFPTSSSPLAGFASIGAGIPPYEIKRIVAVVKAYSSCVGACPFVSEIFGDEAEELRRLGGDCGEYGATTGRPRRMGWFDAVATRYGCRIQGATEVTLTLLDVLGFRDEIPVCVGYEIDGEITQDFPVSAKLAAAKPVLETLPGWRCDVSSIRKFSDLPKTAQDYVNYIENVIETPITMISVGPQRDAMIIR